MRALVFTLSRITRGANSKSKSVFHQAANEDPISCEKFGFAKERLGIVEDAQLDTWFAQDQSWAKLPQEVCEGNQWKDLPDLFQRDNAEIIVRAQDIPCVGPAHDYVKVCREKKLLPVYLKDVTAVGGVIRK